jgi:hypothetical protein
MAPDAVERVVREVFDHIESTPLAPGWTFVLEFVPLGSRASVGQA